MKNIFLEKVLSVVAQKYKVPKREVKTPQTRGTAQTDVILCRGAYMYLATNIGFTNKAAAEYIGANLGNCVNYKKQFEGKVCETEKKRLIKLISKP